MRKKGFTLVELLVVIAIIALLMSILMPALAQVRRLAQRMMCGTNLKGIGNAIVTYSNDNDEEFPRAGRARGRWGVSTQNWTKTSETAVWGNDPIPNDGYKATIGSCLYFLIKYADVTPKQMICNGDQRARVFKHTEHLASNTTLELTKLWDFGKPGSTPLCPDDPGIHYSYSYHYPFNHSDSDTSTTYGVNFALTASSNPAQAIAADRNPLLDYNAKEYVENKDRKYRGASWSNSMVPANILDPDKVSNSASHQRDGQQVLYVDAHVEWEKMPNCGVENDNIYKPWPNSAPNEQERQFGNQAVTFTPTIIGTSTPGPRGYTDTFLINELNAENYGS